MKEFELKYGCNPNQKPSRIFMKDGSDLPVEVLNGLLKTFYGHTSPFQRRQLTAGGTPRPSQR